MERQTGISVFFLRGEVGGLNDFRMETKKRDAVDATPGVRGLWGLSKGEVPAMCVGGDRDGGYIWCVSTLSMEFCTSSGGGAPGKLGRRERGAGIINSGCSAARRHAIDVLSVDVAASGHSWWLCTCQLFLTHRLAKSPITGHFLRPWQCPAHSPQLRSEFPDRRVRDHTPGSAYLCSMPLVQPSPDVIPTSRRCAVFHCPVNQRSFEHAAEGRPVSASLRLRGHGHDNRTVWSFSTSSKLL